MLFQCPARWVSSAHPRCRASLLPQHLVTLQGHFRAQSAFTGCFWCIFCGLCSSFNPFPGCASYSCHQEMSWLCAAALTSIFLALSSGLGTGGDTGDGRGHHVPPGAQGHHVLPALGARRCLGHPECPQPCLSSVVSPRSSSWRGLTPSGQWHLGTAAADPEVSLGIEASGGKCTKNRAGENPGAGFTPQKKLPNT